jgi:hypothetical protein
VFAAIERAIGDGSSASVSYVDFRLDHHIGRRAVSPSLKLLDHLGLIEIDAGYAADPAAHPRARSHLWVGLSFETR